MGELLFNKWHSLVSIGMSTVLEHKHLRVLLVKFNKLVLSSSKLLHLSSNRGVFLEAHCWLRGVGVKLLGGAGGKGLAAACAHTEAHHRSSGTFPGAACGNFWSFVGGQKHEWEQKGRMIM